MPAKLDEVHQARMAFACDNCNRAVLVTQDLSEGRRDDLEFNLPENWISCRHPDVNLDENTFVYFHTRRCAIGWFRAFVAQAYGVANADEPEGPFIQEDAVEAGESPELLNAAWRASRDKGLPADEEKDVASPTAAEA